MASLPSHQVRANVIFRNENKATKSRRCIQTAARTITHKKHKMPGEEIDTLSLYGARSTSLKKVVPPSRNSPATLTWAQVAQSFISLLMGIAYPFQQFYAVPLAGKENPLLNLRAYQRLQLICWGFLVIFFFFFLAPANQSSACRLTFLNAKIPC